ncbi:MAG: peptidylprolyl isomerase [Myxococcales bacterium]|nr:peptidylprolyl isomerase [Myxococcales bacterium]
MSLETIAMNSVVQINYVLRGDDGAVIDQSEPGEPLTYMHGHHQIVVGLENALAGKNVGDKVEVKVQPEEGYGRRDGTPQPIDRSAFPASAVLEPGTQFIARAPDGSPFPIWIAGVSGNTIFIDRNHPLAGKILHFTAEVTGVRQATAEELSHGHVHGPGGHHHH